MWATRSHDRWWSGFRPSGDVPLGGRRKKENMAAKISGGRDETGASALRRSLNARMESSNALISASMACRWYSREFGFIAKANGVTPASGVSPNFQL